MRIGQRDKWLRVPDATCSVTGCDNVAQVTRTRGGTRKHLCLVHIGPKPKVEETRPVFWWERVTN